MEIETPPTKTNNLQNILQRGDIPSPSSPISKFSSIKRVVAFLIPAILVLLLGVYFFYQQRKATEQYQKIALSAASQGGHASQSVSDSDAFRKAQALIETKILSHAKISFPATSQENNIDFQKLPDTIQKIIGSDNTGLQAWEVNYENGQKGFKVIYQAQASLTDYSVRIDTLMANIPKVQLLNQEFASYFGLTEFSLADQKFQVSQKADHETKDTASIVVIQSVYGNSKGK